MYFTRSTSITRSLLLLNNSLVVSSKQTMCQGLREFLLQPEKLTIFPLAVFTKSFTTTQCLLFVIDIPTKSKKKRTKIATTSNLESSKDIDTPTKNKSVNNTMKNVDDVRIKRKSFTKEDDELILKSVSSFGYNTEAFKQVTVELNRNHWQPIKTRYDHITSSSEQEKPIFVEIKFKRNHYTKEEDKIILNSVENNGYFPETFRLLCKILKRPRWDHIQIRYNTISTKVQVHEIKNKKLEQQKIIKQKRFSKEEDELILNQVKRYGATIETFKKINLSLNRTQVDIIKQRFLRLKSKGQDKPKKKERRPWALLEEEIMIEFMLKFISSANEINKDDSVCKFKSVARSIERSELACYRHWHDVLLPILKTHELGISQTHVWQNDVMKYISESKISDIEDVDFYYLENKLCPGQTISRIKPFVRGLRTKKLTVKGEVPSTKTIELTEPLYEICLQRLKCPRAQANFAPKSTKSKQQRIKEIVDIYNKLSKKIQ